jgi:hypothetical protein
MKVSDSRFVVLVKIIRYSIIQAEVSVLCKSLIANHRFLFLGEIC